MKVTRLLADDREESAPLQAEVLIGRREGDFVVRDDPYVSSRHAVVRLHQGQPVLEDLQSTNGTYLRIQGEVELRPGDYVRLGGQTFRFLV